MSKSNSPPVDIQYFIPNFPERRITPQMLPAIGFRFRRSLAGNHLGSERFVDFDQFGIFQTEAGSLFSAVNCVDWTETHPRRVEPGIGVALKPAKRSKPRFLEGPFGHQEQSGRSIRDLRRVPGGYGSGFRFKRRLQPGQRFHRLIFSGTIVLVHERLPVLCLWQIDGSDLLFQFFSSRDRLLMRPHGKGVLLFTGDVKIAADGFRRLTHIAPADWVGKSELQADERLKIGWSEAAQHAEFLRNILGSRKGSKLLGGFMGKKQRDLRHAFDAADDKDVAPPGQHLFRSLSDRFKPRGTVPMDRNRRYGFGDAGSQSDDSTDIR